MSDVCSAMLFFVFRCTPSIMSISPSFGQLSPTVQNALGVSVDVTRHVKCERNSRPGPAAGWHVFGIEDKKAVGVALFGFYPYASPTFGGYHVFVDAYDHALAVAAHKARSVCGVAVHIIYESPRWISSLPSVSATQLLSKTAQLTV